MANYARMARGLFNKGVGLLKTDVKAMWKANKNVADHDVMWAAAQSEARTNVKKYGDLKRGLAGKVKQNTATADEITRYNEYKAKHASALEVARKTRGYAKSGTMPMDFSRAGGHPLDNFGKAEAYARGGLGTAADYFWRGATPAQRAARIGTGVAAYGAVNAAGRWATGGSVLYNNNGDRDIAGIPFI